MSKFQSALLTALEDFRQIADFLGQHESVLDTKSFYYTLFAQCFQLHRQVIDIIHQEALSHFLEDKLTRLEALVVPGVLQSCQIQGEAASPYPHLAALHEISLIQHKSHSDKVKILRECIKFDTKQSQTTLIDWLKDSNDFLEAQASEPVISQEVGLAIPLKPRQRPPDGIWPAANSLFNVIDSRRRRCACNPVHTYVVQLCLETHRAKLADSEFGLYFGLGNPQQNVGFGLLWQEARIQTTSSSLPELLIPNTGAHCREQKRIVEELCRDIIKITNTLPGYHLKFRLEENILWKLRSEQSNFKVDKSKPPMSLSQIIAEKSNVLNEKTKRILSVLLGYTVFYLHGTPWLQHPWGSSNVMFFRSYNGVPLRPYIESRLDNLVSDSHEHTLLEEDDGFDPDDGLSPPYPCLVDLAVVLMELHKARHLVSLAETYGIPVVEEMDITARYILAREVFKHCRLDITDQTRMAINMCLNPNIGLDDDGNDLDEHGLRDVIYQQIVRRLEDELEQGFSELSVDKLDTLIQNLDLANGGQPIRLDQKENPSDVIIFNSKQKRQHPEDSTGRRVRFPPLPDPGVSNYSSQSIAPEPSIPNESRLRIHHDKGNYPSSLYNVHQKDNPRAKANGQSATRPDTIRVLNVPDDMIEHKLKTELEKLFNSACKVHSLARASRDVTSWRKYATVTFPEMPNEMLNNLIKTEVAKLRGPFNFHYDTTFLGLTPLYDADEDAIVDIIAIEGLGTNPFGTFRAPQGDEMWLRDYLRDNFESSRVLLYGYDSKVLSSRTDQSIREIASTCKNFIANFRRLTATEYRPVIWIGQSMGGLIVQEVLTQSHQHKSLIPGNLLTYSIGFLGYGVPINGLKNDSLLNVARGQPNFDMIKSICIEDGRPSRYLNDLAHRFALCNENLSIHYFYETSPSPDLVDAQAPHQRRVDDPRAVDRENRYWLPRNHSELVKIASRSDYTYLITIQVLSLILSNQ